MTTVKDIAKILAHRHKLSNAEADIFMQMIVEVINDGLLKDRIVKIKGFGTFKLQTVKERTSVNVNTGERVLITEHDKVAFVPDNVMKDLINKPFAQFETVIVNDEGLLNDGEMETDVYPDTEDEISYSNTAVGSSDVEEVETKSSAMDTNKVEQPEEVAVAVTVAKAEETLSEVLTQEKVEHEAANCDDEETVGYEHTYPHCRNIFIYYGILINVVVAVIAFALGFIASSQQWFGREEVGADTDTAKVVEKQQQNVVKSQMKQAGNIEKKASSVTAETKDTIKQKTTVTEHEGKQQVTSPSTVGAVEQTDNKSVATPLRQYETDVRVRTGAYYIMGTSKEVIVQKGQTLKSISRAHLGEGMECYIEAYNDIKTVKQGDKIKIPKLKLKKRSR